MAAKIARTIQSHGREAAGKLALLSSAPDSYRPLVDEIFEAWGIPVAAAGGRPASESLLARTLQQYLELLEADFPREDLFDLLLAPCLYLPGLPPHLLRVLRVWARRLRVEGGIDHWLNGFPQTVEQTRQWGLRGGPAAAREPVIGPDAWLEFRAALEQLRLKVDPKVRRPLWDWYDRVAQRLGPCLAPPRAATPRQCFRDNRLLQQVVRRLGECALPGLSGPVSFTWFRQWMAAQLREARCCTDPATGAVLFGTPEELRHLDLEGVFWLGLVDGEFPCWQSRTADPARDAPPPDPRQTLDHSLDLFESLGFAARTQLVLSLPATLRDTAVEPSCLLGQAPTEDAPEVRPPSPDDPERAARIERGREVQRIRERSLLSGWQGRLSVAGQLRQARELLFPRGLVVTPSQLEHYSRCGYRYFLREVVGLEPEPEAAEELPARELGVLLHRTLSRFFGAGYQSPGDLAASQRGYWITRQLSRMSRLLREERERLVPPAGRDGGAFQDFQWDWLRAGLDGSEPGGILAEFVVQQWKLRASRVIGVELALPALNLGAIPVDEKQVMPVTVRGKVDRLDQRARSLAVIDYKTGPGHRSRLNQGWGFQLPLYLSALEASHPGRRVDGVFYVLQPPQEVRWSEVRLRDRNGRPIGLEPMLNFYREKARATVRNLHRGEFPVTLLPPQWAGCSRCPFRLACRYEPQWAQALRDSKGFPAVERVVAHGCWIGPEVGP